MWSECLSCEMLYKWDKVTFVGHVGSGQLWANDDERKQRKPPVVLPATATALMSGQNAKTLRPKIQSRIGSSRRSC